MSVKAIIKLLLPYPHARLPTSEGRLRRVVASPYPGLIFSFIPGYGYVFLLFLLFAAVFVVGVVAMFVAGGVAMTALSAKSLARLAMVRPAANFATDC